MSLFALSVATLVATGCSTPNARQPTTAELARRYLAIAIPANKALEKSFDALESGTEPSTTTALLRAIAATERRFDRDLCALTLPAPTDRIARALVRANEARADMTDQVANNASDTSLKRVETVIDGLNGPVESQVRLLRADLGLPPPGTD